MLLLLIAFIQALYNKGFVSITGMVEKVQVYNSSSMCMTIKFLLGCLKRLFLESIQSILFKRFGF